MGSHSGRRAVWHPQLGVRVKLFRERAGKTQEGIEIAIGYSKGVLSRIEKGDVAVELSKFPVLCKEIGIDQDILAYPTELTDDQLFLFNEFAQLIKKNTPHRNLPAIIELIRLSLKDYD